MAMIDDRPYKKGETLLIQETLDRLLLLLDPDRETAGRKYEQIREKLINYFAWQKCAYPEDLADKTIDRVIAMINRGEEIRSLKTYTLSVARFILLEQHKEQQRMPLSLDDLSSDKHPTTYRSEPAEGQEQELRLKCLEHCMQQLQQKDHHLITQYYWGEARERIENRERLAKQLEISANALCIQVHRIKNKLVKCVGDCLERLPGLK
jgi:DNA-directed RNA polymerase specialized sigma24 family protein